MQISWRMKLIALFTLILSASLLVQIFYIIPYIQDRELENAELRQAEIASSLGREVNIELNKLISTLNSIAGSTVLHNMDIEDQTDLLWQYANLSSEIATLFVMNSTGWYVSGTVENFQIFTTRSYNFSDYYRISFELGGIYISSPRSYYNNTLVSTFISVPIVSETGDVIGILIGTMRLNDLIQRISEYSLNKKQVLYLVNREGIVIAHSETNVYPLNEPPLSLNYSSLYLIKDIMDGNVSGTYEYDINGTFYCGVNKIIESSGWGVIVETPLDEIRHESDVLVEYLWIFNIIIFSATMILTLIFTQQITSMQQRAEEARRESEEKFRNLFEIGRDAIGFSNLDGSIMTVNQGFLDMLSYTREEIKSLNFRDFTPKKWEAMENEIIENQVMKRGYSDVYEKEYIQKNGTVIPIEIRTGLLKDKIGNPTQMFGVIRDITERKQTEEELKRKEKLAVLGQLAGGVGHELRNPLGAIKNAVYFLNMAIEEPVEEVKESLKIIEEEVTTSERIITSLLDFARPKPLNLQNLVINDVVQSAQKYITVPENVTIVNNLDKSLPSIHADSEQLTQVFRNIIFNAIQAMPEGGQLVINSVEKQERVIISFTDSGVGISEENLGRLFEPLFTTKAKGIGLGLVVSKTLIEGHNGRIDVQSKVGKGSTFTIKLHSIKKENMMNKNQNDTPLKNEEKTKEKNDIK